MKLSNRSIWLILALFVAVSSFAQDKFEEQGYIRNPVQTSYGIVFTDNLASAIYQVRDGKSVMLTSSAGCGNFLNFSPDGEKLGFKIIDATGNQTPSIIDLKTGEVQSLHQPVRLAGQVSFTTDGRYAFSIGDRFHISDGRSFDLGVYSNLSLISPDGEVVVFNDNADRLFIMDLVSLNRTQISEDSIGCYNPVWTPDENRILYLGFNGNIYVYDLDLQTIFSIGEGDNPSWSDDSKTVVFIRKVMADFQLINSDIYQINFDGSDLQKLTETPDIFEIDARFYDGNSKLIFQTLDRNEIRSLDLSKPVKSSDSQEILFKPADGVRLNYFEIEDRTKADSVLVVPYVHQVYDVPDWFWGYYACAPTTAAMLLAYYDILPAWECSASSPSYHSNNWGRYVCERYMYRETDYNSASSPNGHTAGKGGYGYMWGTGGTPNSKMANYYQFHGLTATQIWPSSTTTTWNIATAEIANGRPYTMCVWLTSSGHLVLGKGVVEGQHTMIFNDPYGDKNKPGYPNYYGFGAKYDWPGYNHGNVNLASAGSGIPWCISVTGHKPAPADTLIDDLQINNGFYLHAKAPSTMANWRDKKTGGYNNHFWWTYTTADAVIDTGYAVWTPNLPQTGFYEVFVYIPSTDNQTDSAKYVVNHSDGSSEVWIDQTTAAGNWVSLGKYIFENDGTQNIRLGDGTGVRGKKIVFDAVKFVELDQPVVAFDANRYSGNAPLTVEFNEMVEYAPENCSWFWEFGDGETSSESNPKHVYQEKGIYTVTLTVNYAAVSYSTSRTALISVGDPLNGDFPLVIPENLSQISTQTPLFFWIFTEQEQIKAGDVLASFIPKGMKIPTIASNQKLTNVGIETYRLFIDTDSDFSDVAPALVDTNFYKPDTALIENANYYWMVEAVTLTDTSRSAIWTFNINSKNSPPQTFTLISPYPNDLSESPLMTFCWNESSDLDVGDEITYQLRIGKVITDMQIVYSGTATSCALTQPLNDNSVYYWKVDAIDRSGAKTENSEGFVRLIINQQNEPPLPVSLITPTDASVEKDLVPKFYWTKGIDPDPDDKIRYVHNYWIKDGARIYTTKCDTNTLKSKRMKDNSQYFWTIQTVDFDSAYSFSDTLTFYTDAYPEAPKAFATVSPINESQSGVNATFVWHPASDPDPLDFPTYQLVYSKDWSDSTKYNYIKNIPDTSVVVLLENDSEIYWLVEAVDKDGLKTGANGNLPFHLVVSGTGIDVRQALPRRFALYPNYPNPFNPTTSIRYDLPNDAFVRLQIFDMLGKPVRLLVQKKENAGYKSVVWNGKDDFGRPVSGGVYFYRLEAGEFQKTGKMVLVK